MRHGHPHPRPQQRLSRRHEAWVYATAGGLALSGIGWLIAHYLQHPPGPGPNPLEGWWLRFHGACLLAFLVVLGTLLPVHVTYGWRHRMNLGTGLPVLLVMVLLTATGYGLYYLVEEDWRAWDGLLHWGLGLFGVALLALHAVRGRQTSRARRHAGHHENTVRVSTAHPGHRPPR